jgi:transketolase
MSAFFQEAFPHRYFEMGIAEQNMLSTAAGLALAGKVPFANSFAVFASGRAYDQIRQTISIASLNVNICGSSAGLSDFGDGSTHQSVEDVAIMRAIPNMTVLVPLDAVQTKQMVRAAANHPGPVYLRINRNDLPVYTDNEAPFEIGKAYVLRPGTDVVVFANGVMISKAMEASDILAREGVSVEVVNVCSVKPLDAATVQAETRKCGVAVVAEEHSVIGGLGSAVAECLRLEKLPLEIVGIQDCFGTSAENYNELMAAYGLTVEAIVAAIRKTRAVG